MLDERTVEILKRFNRSWVETEEHYNDLIDRHKGFERLRPIREFIIKLKSQGWDNFFRLGTSMHSLILSRSVDHGLRSDQKMIKIDAIKQGDFEVTLKDGEKVYRQFRVGELQDIRLTKLLATLKHTLVD